jgi:hypothetical protein
VHGGVIVAWMKLGQVDDEVDSSVRGTSLITTREIDDKLPPVHGSFAPLSIALTLQ